MLICVSLQPENCHVMFIKSIVFQTPTESSTDAFPDTNLDPFIPSLGAATDSGVGAGMALKPFPPPTPSLVELPTCPVCLERMDDTTGLLTILCQHVFHCACLSKWRGSGCPVCRHTQPQPSLSQPFGASASDFCRVCDCGEDLWICLICGHVGCGRYKGGHAKDHWKETAHNYALEIETQHVWDYAGDLWVHRLIQNKGDGKLVELPSNSRPSQRSGASRENHYEEEDVEMVPRVKLDNIGMEYTHLLTSQLESQRVYFEDIIKKAASKASAASKAAETAAAKTEEALAALQKLSFEHAKLRDEIVPCLEKERDRLKVKTEKTSELARAMTSRWQEEKKVGEGLMERIKHVNEGMAGMSKELTLAKQECEDLKEQNRDLSFFISGQEKLKELQKEGELAEDITEGTMSLPPARKDAKGKGKGRGRGK
jgi:BRCA1-associated protein